MSIKPVDFQVMLPKTSEISKIHSEGQHKSQALQQQQEALTQHRVETELTQVHSQEKTQEARIREKQEKNKRRKREDEEEKEKEQEKEREKNNLLYNKDKKIDSKKQTSTIDIRL